MVANEEVAVPESPARQDADPNRPEYVKAWLVDLGGSISDEAEALSTKFEIEGYCSKRSLRSINEDWTPAEFAAEFGVPRGMARGIIRESILMHVSPNNSTSNPSKKKCMDSAIACYAMIVTA